MPPLSFARRRFAPALRCRLDAALRLIFSTPCRLSHAIALSAEMMAFIFHDADLRAPCADASRFHSVSFTRYFLLRRFAAAQLSHARHAAPPLSSASFRFRASFHSRRQPPIFAAFRCQAAPARISLNTITTLVFADGRCRFSPPAAIAITLAIAASTDASRQAIDAACRGCAIFAAV